MRFDSYHPALNFMFFAAVITMAICFNQPVFLALSYLTSFTYSVKLNGVKAAIFNLVLIPLILLYTWIYSGYNHFGITNLAVNFIGNRITLESVTVGLVIGITIAVVLMWLSCVHAVISSDKVVYLFGRISPKLSLFLSILLRMVPRIKEKAKKIHTAQKCIGKGIGQGNPFRRACNLFRIISIVIAWTMENFIETSESMRSRGYTLKKRTAFSIYRFDYRDRTMVISMFLFITVILMGILFDQTRILYNPEIIMNKVTPLSAAFYLAYASFCLMPMALQIFGEFRWKMRIFVKLSKEH